jgi:hypothetical protein
LCREATFIDSEGKKKSYIVYAHSYTYTYIYIHIRIHTYIQGYASMSTPPRAATRRMPRQREDSGDLMTIMIVASETPLSRFCATEANSARLQRRLATNPASGIGILTRPGSSDLKSQTLCATQNANLTLFGAAVPKKKRVCIVGATWSGK